MPSILLATNRFDVDLGVPAADRSTTAGNFDGNCVDQGWNIDQTSSSPKWGISTTDHVWVHFYQKMEDNNNFDGFAHYFADDDNNLIVFLDIEDGNYRIQGFTGSVPADEWRTNSENFPAGNQFALTTIGGIVNRSTGVYIDVHFNYDEAEVGTGNIGISLYANGVRQGTVVLEASGRGKCNNVVWRADDIGPQYVSGFIAAEFCTVGMRVHVLRPDGAGDLDDFTNDEAALIDRDPETSRTGNSGGARFTQTLSEISATADGAGHVFSVIPIIDALASGGLTSLRASLRIDGTNYDGASLSIGETTTVVREEFLLNPDTAAPWEWADIATLQVGVVI